jgi:hypothetical protein
MQDSSRSGKGRARSIDSESMSSATASKSLNTECALCEFRSATPRLQFQDKEYHETDERWTKKNKVSRVPLVVQGSGALMACGAWWVKVVQGKE